MTTLLRMTSQQEQPLSYVHCAWLHWKAGASVFTEGKHERKTVLVLEERGMKEEEREGKREMRRKRVELLSLYSNTQPISSYVTCIFP